MTSVAHLGSDHLGPLPRVVHPGEGRGLRQLKLLHHQGLLWQGEQCAKSQSNPLLYAHGSGLLHLFVQIASVRKYDHNPDVCSVHRS